MAQNISVISLIDPIESAGETDKSVVFVSEEKASNEMKRIAELNQKVSELTSRNHRLEIHVEALQKRILNPETGCQQVESNDRAMATTSIAVTSDLMEVNKLTALS